MLKSVERLLGSENDLKIGNHSSEFDEKTWTWHYKYHGITICEANYVNRWFRLPYNKRMYADSHSTKMAVNDYRRYFLEKGFAFIED